jgi:hypothetical protein
MKKSFNIENFILYGLHLNKNMYKNTFFKEKLFTTEVQGILEGAWLVRRL